MYKVTLPGRWAGEVLRLLAKEGVHAGSLFPDFNGVIEAIRERDLWGVSDDFPPPEDDGGFLFELDEDWPEGRRTEY